MQASIRLERVLAVFLIACIARSAPPQSAGVSSAPPAATAPPANRSASADPYGEAKRLIAEKKFAEAGDVLAALAAKNPWDGWIWGNRGYCLHALGRYSEAIPFFQKAVELDASPATYLYDLCCSSSLMGNKDEAFAWLKKALDARFVDQSTLEEDTDLDPLRGDPRFAELTGITLKLKAPLVHSRDEGWRWDLDFYARRMKQMHWSLYDKVSETDFHAALESLKRDVASLDDDQARARLRKITATVGDGHTVSMVFAEGNKTIRRLPIHLYSFKEGLYVIGASKDHTDLIGANVIAIGSLAADAALAAVRPYISVDNEMGYRNGAPDHLVLPIFLREIGAARDESGADITIRTSNDAPRNVHLEPVDAAVRTPGGFFRSDFTYMHQAGGQAPPYLRETARNLRLDSDADRKLVYFRFGAIADDPDMTIAKLSEQLFERIEQEHAEHLVIDMRFNGGGNTDLIRPLINGLGGAKRVNREGHLWVIIGRRTFSAAQNTVNLINAFDHPIFVGEPTGSRPRFIGESTSFVLPHARTRVYCSSRYWQVLDSTDDRCWIPPQIAAEPTFADYSAGRDPAMEAIHAAVDAAKERESPGENEPR
jgi:tetratricopeptide (TPR) repeat protein